MTATYKNDISAESANRAAAGFSFSPERRGESLRNDYSAELEGFREVLFRIAGADRAQEAEEDFERYRAGLRAKYHAWISAQSNCISWMITGPSKFPTRRAEKANQTERNRLEDLIKFQQVAKRRIFRKYQGEDCIRGGTADARTELEKKRDALAAKQTLMVAANKIYRTKLDDDAKVAKLVELGMNAKEARARITPDCCGRVGFADYETANNRANLKRVEERIVIEQREQERRTAIKDAGASEREFEGGRISEDAADNRLRIYFDRKPEYDMIQRLKRSGWRWSPNAGAWQRQLTQAARASAQQLTS